MYLYVLIYHFRFYLGLARQVCCSGCEQIPTHLVWLIAPYGHRFIVSQRWHYGASGAMPSPFNVLTPRGDPVAYAARAYREHLLARSLQTLIAPGTPNAEDEPLRKTQTADVLTYVQLLMENSIATGPKSEQSSTFNVSS